MDRKKTMERLKKRADFLAAAGGLRASRRGFLLQRRDREGAGGEPPRFGFTVTKKMGNSPERNRIRRRLREAVRLGAAAATPGADYVLIGRRSALSQPFDDLLRDLASGLAALSARRAAHLASHLAATAAPSVAPKDTCDER